MELSCNICAENIKSFSVIKCPFCEFSTCKECQYKYILDSDRDKKAHCMSCKHEWTREILIKLFSKSWVEKAYSNYIMKQTLNIEKALFPATQPLVEIELKKCDIEEEILKLYAQIKELKNESRGLDTLLYNLKNNKSKIEATSLKCKCPAADCKGFITDKWRCGLCKTHVCSKCYEIKPDRGPIGAPGRLEKHKCDKDAILTVELLKKDTKPCPKCACMIFKIEGCDQIWCIKCHTAFSWKTGLIDNGPVHNPHYYEMLRNLNGGGAPRNQGDFICGGLPTLENIRARFLLMNKQDKKQWIHIMDVYRSVSHIMNDTMVNDYPIINRVNENIDLRIRYMMNKIDEKKFLSDIKRRMKKKEIHHEIHQILEMFVNTMISLFGNILESKTDKTLFLEVDNVEKLRLYYNKEIRKVSNIYSHNPTYIYINKSWTFLSQKEYDAMMLK